MDGACGNHVNFIRRVNLPKSFEVAVEGIVRRLQTFASPSLPRLPAALLFSKPQLPSFYALLKQHPPPPPTASTQCGSSSITEWRVCPRIGEPPPSTCPQPESREGGREGACLPGPTPLTQSARLSVGLPSFLLRPSPTESVVFVRVPSPPLSPPAPLFYRLTTARAVGLAEPPFAPRRHRGLAGPAALAAPVSFL